MIDLKPVSIKTWLFTASILVAWLVMGCRPASESTPALDLIPVLQNGAFLPARSVSELAERTATGEASGWSGESYWDPLRIVPGDGWGRANKLGWRPMGDRSTLLLYMPKGPVDSPEGAELLFEWHTRLLEGRTAEVDAHEVSVRWNGESLGDVELGVGRSAGRLPIPQALLADVNQVEMRFDPPLDQSPKGAQTFALERFGVVAADREATPPGRSRVDSQQGLLQIAGAGHFVAPMDLPKDAQSLRFDLRWRTTQANPSHDRLSLVVITADGEHQPLMTIEGSAGRQWSSQEGSVVDWGGQDIILVIEVNGDATVEIRAPQLTLRTAGDLEEKPATQTRPSSVTDSGVTDSRTTDRASEPLPDIILILLDAARGDRLANPNYPRQTTPNIDRMATDALVFRRAYSECPSTNCSIPNLLTGLPFLAAGMERSGWLNDRAQTLAESLQTIGYRAVGFSANPNNSASRNHHQGFNEFYKLWGRNPDHGPYGMSRRAAAVIADQAADEPLFLQLHYLPPHEPYEPLPEFDVFSDPDYQGPIAPGTSPRPYRPSRADLTDADVARFIDLYDGNLRMVDDAVAQVFAALESAGRWDNSIILVSSDHGEAFWENGQQGHNTTLFDGMLHVPFILRLPVGSPPVDVDTERLVSLSDVVPTLLGRVGLAPAPGVIGVDLLATETATDRPRRLFHRTNNSTSTQWSVRTPRFKAFVRPRLQQQQFFDLLQDPGETHNLIGERPLHFAGLSLLIRRHLAVTSAVDLASEEAPMSEEDQEVLRSLGYL